jgi:hypothetical protein
MPTKTKGRNGGDRATLKTLCCRNHTSIASRIKAVIVRAACWGVLPLFLAEWFIKRLHLENAE